MASAITDHAFSNSSDWEGLEEISEDETAFFSPQNALITNHHEDEGHVNIPDLNERPRKEKGKELTTTQRLEAIQLLLAKSKDGVLQRGVTKDVASQFGVGIRTIQRIWKRARESGNNCPDKLRVQNCGRKRIEVDLERIRNIPLRQRTTIRSLAFALGVSKTILHNKLKEGVIRRHTNAIKPTLSTDNHMARMDHCLRSLDPASFPLQPTFKQMHNIVHIDEKWFYLTKKSQTYYMLHDENDPVRTIQSSHFIPKVMFLVAVARPRFDLDGVCTFDGKIGVFPFVESVAALRSSQNRPRGTLEIKPIANITRDINRTFMISKVLPAIASKWPRDSINDAIYIQQDNARSHIHIDDVEFVNAVHASGLNISLVCQPPNSPDLNVLDLGFFRAIQSLQSKDCAKSVANLIGAVEQAFQDFPVKQCNKVFLTLQSCMIEILKCHGSNAYKIPHMNKDRLERHGALPSSLSCSPNIVTDAVMHLSS